MSYEYEDEFERPKAEGVPNQSTQDFFHGLPSARLLEAYLKRMLLARLKTPNDPQEQSLRNGTIRDIIHYLQLDIDSIAVTKDTASAQMDSFYRISCSMSGGRGKSWYQKDIRLYCGIEEGASFTSILKALESEVIEYPCDALTYLQQKNFLPKGISVVPSTGNYGKSLTEETYYSTKVMRARLPDPRIYSNEYLDEKAEEVQKMLIAMQKDEKIKRLHIDIDSEDPWSIILYSMKIDFIRQFRHVLSQATSEIQNFPNVIGPSDALPAKYMHMQSQDIHIAIDPIMRDFLDGCTNYVIGKVDSLSQEWKEIVVRVLQLRQDPKGFEDNGGLAMGHDPRECDGVTVQFHCRNPKPL